MRYRTLTSYFRERFKSRARKIPLEAGFSCPNRDGTLSFGGCLFCNELGSGAGLTASGLPLSAQWDALRTRFSRKYPDAAFLAYLQSFSNTHGPASRLKAVLDQIAALPGARGLCLGTRPDCLDEEKLDLLAALPFEEIRLEMGLQSANDATLSRINRGHGAADFARAAELAAERGIKVTAHVMAGLPGEDAGDFLRTVDFAAALPVHGIKLHNLLVVAGSPLAPIYMMGGYTPLERAEYVSMLCRAIPRLRPDMVVERLNADPGPGELLAPDWAADKSGLLRDIGRAFEAEDVWQGAAFCAKTLPMNPTSATSPEKT